MRSNYFLVIFSFLTGLCDSRFADCSTVYLLFIFLHHWLRRDKLVASVEKIVSVGRGVYRIGCIVNATCLEMNAEIHGDLSHAIISIGSHFSGSLISRWCKSDHALDDNKDVRQPWNTKGSHGNLHALCRKRPILRDRSMDFNPLLKMLCTVNRSHGNYVSTLVRGTT